VQNSVGPYYASPRIQHFLIGAKKRIDTHAELQYLGHFLSAFGINRKTFTFANSLQRKITLPRILE